MIYTSNVYDTKMKLRTVKYVKKLIHTTKDVVNDEDIENGYVEVLIVGKVREWVDFWPLTVFENNNPGFEDYS